MKTVQDIRRFSTGICEPYIFISYSHDDGETVKKLAEGLKAEGFCVWVDYDNIRGHHFSDDMKNGIRECAVFLQCLSRSYIEKPYCEKEYKLADDENKNWLAVAIDDVSKNDNPNAFPYGGNVYGYGKGLISSFEEIYSSLLQSAILTRLKNGGEELSEYMFAGEKVLTLLNEHCRSTYECSGTYLLNEIHRELFTDILDEDRDEIYGGLESTEVSLYNYLKSDQGHGAVLLLGDGGTGKTVSMVRTCRRLLEEQICAVYVPLNKVWFDGVEDPVKHYIRKRIFGEESTLFDNFRNMINSGVKNNVFLFLDGVNELKKQSLERLKEFLVYAASSREWSGTRIILSSRTELEPEREEDMQSRSSLKKLRVLPLGEENIRRYLEKLNMPVPEHPKVLELIRNPLMLSLYADAEKYAELYRKKGKKFEIRLEEQPDTAAKIIGNFMQTQLFQMASVSNESSNFILYHTLIEYALPAIAFQMILSEGLLTEKAVRKILIEYLDEDNEHFAWYSDEVLENLWWDYGVEDSYISRNDIRKICDFAIKNYRFLYVNNTSEYEEEPIVEFLHQEFRDYFAGAYIGNEIRMLRRQKKYLKHGYSSLHISKVVLNQDILEYCSGYLREERACPYFEDNTYIFPGKTDREPSEYSVTEQVLPLLRGKREEQERGTRVLVSNLILILRTARENLLAQCDFSDLDLRGCRMNGCHFAEYHMGKIWSSVFDRAVLAMSFFLNEGHSEAICAVAEGRDSLIYSIDEGGELIRWNYRTNEVRSVRTYDDMPKEMIYDENTDRLCIAFERQIVLLECGSFDEVCRVRNQRHMDYFRYVKIARDGRVKYAYDLEPFRWFDLQTGEEEADNREFSVISGCAHEYEKAGKIVYSIYGRNLCVLDMKELADQENAASYIRKNMKWLAAELPETATRKGKLYAISSDEEERRFVVAVGSYLLEYDLRAEESIAELPPLKQYHYSGDIRDVKYLKGGGMVAAIGKTLTVLDRKGNISHLLRKKSGAEVRCLLPECDIETEHMDTEQEKTGKAYYLVSQEGVVKKLNYELCVTQMRKIRSTGRFVWVRDRKTKEIQMMFGATDQYRNGYRMSFDTGEVIPSGWCFETLDEDSYFDYNRQQYTMHQSVSVYDRSVADAVWTYDNVSGVWIFGCSFRGLSGDMKEKEAQLFLKKNGGIVDEDARDDKTE